MIVMIDDWAINEGTAARAAARYAPATEASEATSAALGEFLEHDVPQRASATAAALACAWAAENPQSRHATIPSK